MHPGRHRAEGDSDRTDRLRGEVADRLRAGAADQAGRCWSLWQRPALTRPDVL
jgi:hypothetical protein